MSFRFIHTADVHLDSPLRSLALKDQGIAELVSNATRETFVRIVDLCISEEVDALLIAGDLFDGELHSMKTAAFFSKEMRRLTNAHIKAYLLRGNHDALSKLTRHLQLPDGVFVFPGKPTSFELKENNAILHALSFAKPKVPDSLVPKYPAPVEGAINIGLLHTSLAGSGAHDTYSPCSLDDLETQGYDYWALGHIHKRQIVEMASSTIVMPGIPQGRHINEAGSKSVTLVDISDAHEVRTQEHFLAVAQFERLGVDLSGLSEWSEMIERVKSSIAVLQHRASAEQLITRIELTGKTQLAPRMHRDHDLLLEEMRQIASACGAVHCEQISVQTKRPEAATSPVGAAPDPLRELQQIALETTTRQPLMEHEFSQLLKKLTGKLPAELRDNFDSEALMDPEALTQIFENGLETVLARMESSNDTTNGDV